jgi:hypothetical protein
MKFISPEMLNKPVIQSEIMKTVDMKRHHKILGNKGV